ncbi:hypothetical protein AB0H77_08815 [Streptomyces sp. NPDC050844]|uniref:hypothetical protein n=1 Tax=Streptomyces sp. NPDC050844 TaxID=3155790 RepID=UPI0033ED461E
MTRAKRILVTFAIAAAAAGGASTPAFADSHRPVAPLDSHSPVAPLDNHAGVTPLDNHAG